MEDIKGGIVDIEGLVKAGTLLGVKHIESKTGMVGLGELVSPFVSQILRDARIPATLNVDPGVWALGKFVWASYENNQMRLEAEKQRGIDANNKNKK